MTYYTKDNVPKGTFSTLHFAAVREREGRDCLVAKTISFNITKLLRPDNIANGVQNPGLSLRAGGQGFSPATTGLSPGYFDSRQKYWKEKNASNNKIMN